MYNRSTGSFFNTAPFNRSPKDERPAPSVPYPIEISANWATLMSDPPPCSQGIVPIVVCVNVSLPSGSTWHDLLPGATYAAYAYIPETTTHYRSPDSEIGYFTTPFPQKNYGLKLTFDTKRLPDPGMKAVTIEGKQQRSQMINLQLLTELGETMYPGLGSKLSIARHKNISPSLLREIEKYAIEAVEQIIPEAEVVVQHEPGSGNLASQSINIYIYSAGHLIFKYIF